MVAAQARTPFGETNGKPPTQTLQQQQQRRQQQSQPSTAGFSSATAANKNNNNVGGGGGGLRNVGTGIGVQPKQPGPGAVTRKPLAQLQPPQKPGGNASAGKKKKCFGGGCCKAKKKPGVQKAAPPKGPSSKRRTLGSLFSRKKKATDGASLNKSSKPTTTSKGFTPRFSRLGISSIGQPSAAAAKQSQQRQLQLGNRSSSSVVQSKPQQQPQKSQVPLGAPAKSKNGQKVLSKIDVEKTQKSSESLKKFESELKTGREDSIKEIKKRKKKPVAKCTKSFGKELAAESHRSFQEVKICVAKFDNGMTERKIVMTNIYPKNESTPATSMMMPCAAAETDYPRRKKSYTSLKRANSTERLPPPPQSSEDSFLKSPEKPLPSSSASACLRRRSQKVKPVQCQAAIEPAFLQQPSPIVEQKQQNNNDDNDSEKLKGPTQVRKEIKNLLLQAIDDAADALKKLPRLSTDPVVQSRQLPSSSTHQKGKKKPAKSSSSNVYSLSTSASTTLSSFSSTKQSTAASSSRKQPKTTTAPAVSGSTSSLLCPLHPAAQKALTKPHYSRDQFASRNGRHTVTREYFTAAGDPILSSSTKSMANPEQLNTIIIQNSGKDISGMALDFKVQIKKPDGTIRNMQLGIQLPKF